MLTKNRVIIKEFKWIKAENQLIKPWVIKCCILSLFFISGMKITFVLLLPTVFRVSKYLICIAAFEFSSSAACLISLADSTSAFAERILLYANLLYLAALESELWRSGLNWISLMKISSIYIKYKLHQLPTLRHTDQPVVKYHPIFLVFSQVNLVI